MCALGSMCWSDRTTECQETDRRPLPAHFTHHAQRSPLIPSTGNPHALRMPWDHPTRRTRHASPAPRPFTRRRERRKPNISVPPRGRNDSGRTASWKAARVSFLGATRGADQAVEKFRRMAPAVMSSWDALHTTAPRRKMMTCGDSCRTPVRAAMSCDRGRSARTSTRYACTSGCAARNASTSSKAVTHTGQVGLCLYRIADGARNGSSMSWWVRMRRIAPPCGDSLIRSPPDVHRFHSGVAARENCTTVARTLTD